MKKIMEEHLNWTIVFSYILLAISTYLGNLFGIVADILCLVMLLLVIVVLIWVLYRKGRSMWWLLLSPIAIFPIFVLCASNKRKRVFRNHRQQ